MLVNQKAKKRRISILDRFAWLFRLVMVDVDGISIESRINSNVFEFVISSLQFSCASVRNTQLGKSSTWSLSQRSKRVSPRYSMERVSLSIDPGMMFSGYH